MKIIRKASENCRKLLYSARGKPHNVDGPKPPDSGADKAKN